jgi:CheY-like chemotaxis protein
VLANEPLLQPEPKGAVLFVEDDHDLRVLVRMLLESRGYPVYTAANGSEAMNLLAQIPMPRLVVADLQMPIMDGWEFVRRLKGQATLATLPVVIQSSEDRTPPGGIAAIMRKPVDVAALLAVVARHCG